MSGSGVTPLVNALEEATPGFACGDDVTEGVFQFRMNNITSEGALDLSKKRRVPRDTRNIDRFLLQPGDVLFNATNSPDLVGKAAFISDLDEPAVYSNHFLRLRPRADRLEGRFLSRWLNLQFQHGRFKAMCRQWVNQATVSREALLGLTLSLPSLPEQRRIAEILDKADALRAKRRAALAQLDTLTQSIFLDMFGDPE
ncbi:MAG: restriction endonuclease subunit S [Nitrospira sp.]